MEHGAQKSVILGQALDEYLVEREGTPSLTISQFCERYPQYRKSLRRMLNVQLFLETEASTIDSDETATPPETKTDNTPTVQWPKVGDEFRGFLLSEELGQGGLARVYLAQERVLDDRRVVLKISQYGFGEAKTLGKLSHPNIVPIHGVQFDAKSGLTAVAMPYHGRATFCDIIDEAFAEGHAATNGDVVLKAARLSLQDDDFRANQFEVESRFASQSYEDAIIHLIIQLADALHYTHKSGILHRDLKPSNILLTPLGMPMLLDFNLSTAINKVPAMLGGTLAYMPPEVLSQVLGEVIDQSQDNFLAGDARSDIFSLGAILYELLIGYPPFGEPEQHHTIHEAANCFLELQLSQPYAMTNNLDQLHESLAAIVKKSLCMDIECRQPNAAEFANELREYIQAKQAEALRAKEEATYRRKLSASKPSLLRVAGVFLSLALVLATISGTAAFYLNKPTEHLPAAHQNEPATAPTFEQGIQAYNDQEFHKAAEIFNAVLQSDPENKNALFARAQAYRRAGDFVRALKDYEALAKTEKNSFIDAYVGYCYLYSPIRNTKESIKSYRKAMEAGDNSAATLNNLAVQISASQDFGDFVSNRIEGIRLLDDAIQADPGCQQAYYNRAVMRLGLERVVGAPPIDRNEILADIDNAIKVGPPNKILCLLVARNFHSLVRVTSNTEEKRSLKARGITVLAEAIRCGADQENISKTLSEWIDAPEILDAIQWTESAEGKAAIDLQKKSLPVSFDGFLPPSNEPMLAPAGLLE